MKICNHCQQEKPLEDFYFRKIRSRHGRETNLTGPRHICKLCETLEKRRRRKNPNRQRALQLGARVEADIVVIRALQEDLKALKFTQPGQWHYDKTMRHLEKATRLAASRFDKAAIAENPYRTHISTALMKVQERFRYLRSAEHLHE